MEGEEIDGGEGHVAARHAHHWSRASPEHTQAYIQAAVAIVVVGALFLVLVGQSIETADKPQDLLSLMIKTFMSFMHIVGTCKSIDIEWCVAAPRLRGPRRTFPSPLSCPEDVFRGAGAGHATRGANGPHSVDAAPAVRPFLGAPGIPMPGIPMPGPRLPRP